MVAVPEFLVASLAVLIFAVHLKWVPALVAGAAMVTPLDMLRVFALPVFTLTCVIVAQMARMTRAALIDQLASPYVEMAVLKGRAAAGSCCAMRCRTRSDRSPTQSRSACPTCSAA